MIRIPSNSQNDFVFVAIGYSSDCSNTIPCTEDKSTDDNQPDIDKTPVGWTTNPADAQLRICKYGDMFKAYSRSNNNENETWIEDGSWTRADMSGEIELQIGIMGFSFYIGSGVKYYWGDLIIEEITGFDECLNNGFNTVDGAGDMPSTTVMSESISTTVSNVVTTNIETTQMGGGIVDTTNVKTTNVEIA